MALLHRDRTEERVDDRLGDERLMGDPPIGGPATVERDEHTAVADRDHDKEHDREPEREHDRAVVVERPGRGETFGLIARTVVFTVAVLAVVAMAAANPDDVLFDLEFEQYSTPMWVIITIAAALGAIAGLMVRPRSRR
jgi:uncharacterized integral membrane protein